MPVVPVTMRAMVHLVSSVDLDLAQRQTTPVVRNHDVHEPTRPPVTVDLLHATLADVVVPRARAVMVPCTTVANAHLEAVQAAATAVATVPDLGVLHAHVRLQIDPPPRRHVEVRMSAAARQGTLAMA